MCTLLVSPLVRSISSLRLFEDVQFGTIVRYLLVHTADGRFWRLVLERQETRRDVLPSDRGVRDAASVDGSVAQSSVRSGHAVHAVGGMSLGALNLSTRSALAGRRGGKGDAGAALPSMMEGQAARGDGQLPAGYRAVLDSRLTGSAGVVVGVGSTGTTALPAISPDALGPEFKCVQLCVAFRTVVYECADRHPTSGPCVCHNSLETAPFPSKPCARARCWVPSSLPPVCCSCSTRRSDPTPCTTSSCSRAPATSCTPRASCLWRTTARPQPHCPMTHTHSTAMTSCEYVYPRLPLLPGVIHAAGLTHPAPRGVVCGQPRVFVVSTLAAAKLTATGDDDAASGGTDGAGTDSKAGHPAHAVVQEFVLPEDEVILGIRRLPFPGGSVCRATTLDRTATKGVEDDGPKTGGRGHASASRGSGRHSGVPSASPPGSVRNGSGGGTSSPRPRRRFFTPIRRNRNVYQSSRGGAGDVDGRAESKATNGGTSSGAGAGAAAGLEHGMSAMRSVDGDSVDSGAGYASSLGGSSGGGGGGGLSDSGDSDGDVGPGAGGGRVVTAARAIAATHAHSGDARNRSSTVLSEDGVEHELGSGDEFSDDDDAGDAAMDDMASAGFVLWTTKGVYECVPGRVDPHQAFNRLVALGRERTHGEPLGIALVRGCASTLCCCVAQRVLRCCSCSHGSLRHRDWTCYRCSNHLPTLCAVPKAPPAPTVPCPCTTNLARLPSRLCGNSPR